MRFKSDLSKGVLGKPDPEGLWEEIISHIPDSVLLKDGVKILCVAAGHGTEARILTRRMRSLGRTPEEIKDSIYLIDKYMMFTKPLMRLGFRNVIQCDFLKWETDMKFDVVVGNPPYSGSQALHQQFFVKACEQLEDGGELMFIQPAVPYVNNKDVRRKKPEVQMIELVEKYETHVNVITKKLFDNAAIATGLAITHLTKTPGSTAVQYEDGSTYKDVAIDEINTLGFEPKLYAKLTAKFAKLVESRGSINDVVFCKEDQLKLRLTKFSDSDPKSHDFCTFISRNTKNWDSTKDFGVPLKHEGQRLNVVSYLKTYVARFALALLKINLNQHRGELALVPLVDFDRSWNDEKLCKEFGITDDEYAVIRSIIPTYYEDVQ